MSPPLLLPLLLLGVLLAGLAIGGLAGALIIRRIEHRHPPQGHVIEVQGCPLHYREDGPLDGPAVLMLHGAASNLEEPRSALKEALAGHRAIWLDRPGLGWSGRPKGRWTPKREAALIAAFLDEIKAEKPVVIGHSWGGAIAMRLAMDHPDRIAGLVLIAPALSAWIGEAAWFNKATRWPVFGPLLTRLIVPLTGLPQLIAGAKHAFHPEQPPEDYVKRSALPLLLRASVWKANAEDMAAVNHHLEDQEHRYPEVGHPTLIIAGKADTVLWTKRHAGMAARRMPNAELIHIRGAGHNPHHGHAERIAEAVIEVRRRALAPQLQSPVHDAGDAA